MIIEDTQFIKVFIIIKIFIEVNSDEEIKDKI
jgi:hypothetical protein